MSGVLSFVNEVMRIDPGLAATLPASASGYGVVLSGFQFDGGNPGTSYGVIRTYLNGVTAEIDRFRQVPVPFPSLHWRKTIVAGPTNGGTGISSTGWVALDSNQTMYLTKNTPGTSSIDVDVDLSLDGGTTVAATVRCGITSTVLT